jgi:hypothetical protein
LAAQQHPWIRLAALAIPSYTYVDRIPGTGDLGEFRIVQPILMAHARALGDHLRFNGTLDFEGWTMPDGELTLGGWGEGFIDRRHPHTYVHELMLSGLDLLGAGDGPLRIGISIGKGFAPFGSEDPMSRPALRYPVNHHFSQILERAVLIGAVAASRVTVEGGIFDGDEPEYPGQWPLIRHRFGDSWSLRLTLRPLSWLELEGSRAKVHSPEHRAGAGTDNWKWHASGRAEGRLLGGAGYAMAEWARTSEADGFFVFHSLLVESAWRQGPHRPYVRFERTERPEEQRLANLFRAPRPHLENSILGKSRWNILTGGYRYRLGLRPTQLQVQPFAEASYSVVEDVGGGIFDPAALYGSSRIWSLSLGIRLGWDIDGHRMGRYGVAENPRGHDGVTMHMNQE